MFRVVEQLKSQKLLESWCKENAALVRSSLSQSDLDLDPLALWSVSLSGHTCLRLIKTVHALCYSVCTCLSVASHANHCEDILSIRVQVGFQFSG